MNVNEQGVTLEQQMLCTCLGASITSLCTTPLDVVKVRLQAEQKQNKRRVPRFFTHRLHPSLCDCKKLFSSIPTRFEHTCANLCLRTNPQFILTAQHDLPLNIFRASMKVCKGIAVKEGIGTLWSGLTPALVMSIPGTMIYFTAYDRIKYKLGYADPDPRKLYLPALAGSLSRIAAVTVISPIELLRTKMQSTKLNYAQTYACIRMSIHHNGPLVLFKGLGPSLLRDVPFSAIYWISYEATKIIYAKEPDLTMTFVSGAFSGTIAALLTCPFDVVKTHRQIELGDLTAHNSTNPRPSTISLLRTIYSTKGVGGLFAGILPRLVKVAPACAIMISTYEMGKKYFRIKNAAAAAEIEAR